MEVERREREREKNREVVSKGKLNEGVERNDFSMGMTGVGNSRACFV